MEEMDKIFVEFLKSKGYIEFDYNSGFWWFYIILYYFLSIK